MTLGVLWRVSRGNLCSISIIIIIYYTYLLEMEQRLHLRLPSRIIYLIGEYVTPYDIVPSTDINYLIVDVSWKESYTKW